MRQQNLIIKSLIEDRLKDIKFSIGEHTVKMESIETQQVKHLYRMKNVKAKSKQALSFMHDMKKNFDLLTSQKKIYD